MGQGSSRPEESHRRSRLHRVSTSLASLYRPRRTAPRDTISAPSQPRPNSAAAPSPSRRLRPRPHSVADGPSHFHIPRLQLGDSLDLDFDSLQTRDDVLFTRRQNTSSRRREDRRSYFDRMTSLRPRRRRSPLRREEDQAAFLSRLLSVAAATTAASLVGEDHRSITNTRHLGGHNEDSTFDGFLEALENGRIASALRGENINGDHQGGMPAPLNFFRMFRFPSNSGNRRLDNRPSSNSTDEPNGEDEGRMVPIIIVGIRSVNPGPGASHDDNIPPFLDALSTFPSTLNNSGGNAIDGLLHRPAPTTRFSHRRRASVGGFPTTYDNQRHHPRPPPSTPASSALSAVSSGETTPTRSSSTAPHSAAASAASSRRDSFVRRTAGGLEPTAEEPTQQRTPRTRRLSESDFTRFGSGASRRNGVVEPDHNPGEGSRSWIIYVLGGSYPENHPIVTTPSLFTDSPTYEDMVLLSALLGPAKPPVASEADVASAPGLFAIIAGEDGTIIAVPEPVPQTQNVTGETASTEDNNVLSGKLEDELKEASSPEIITIAQDQRCLVCLSEFEVGEQARKLSQCGHFFHRECIDHWLLNGRNSCPLCRRQGVDEKPSTAPESPNSDTMTFTDDADDESTLVPSDGAEVADQYSQTATSS
ncbi:hypothetical protein EJ05DRAFT_26070 [Pseudovirgaria hyperparasitica]|uniref:RING-type domain-containing protein n=1 Tax=Pseudovirgaria hyperparasitica TaxID=470096 RepID=A0A6A6WLS8_9PEZI|nr:uncharacterized protein EJ05DRAFT_26070 [Pseudovirgaria hyperparasitica]KAF2763108.1 hypothetical protein EJ05DRAFT_26070 [Pseudovirgaria hyperparasitica]